MSTRHIETKCILDPALYIHAAIKMYLKYVAEQEGIPRDIITKNGYTLAEEDAIIKAAEEAKKGRNITKAMNMKEAITYLKSLA